jgi:hypothetical protein
MGLGVHIEEEGFRSATNTVGIRGVPRAIAIDPEETGVKHRARRIELLRGNRFLERALGGPWVVVDRLRDHDTDAQGADQGGEERAFHGAEYIARLSRALPSRQGSTLVRQRIAVGVLTASVRCERCCVTVA